jgi:hypothetical protein
VNCFVVPFAIDGLAGVTAIDTNVGATAVTRSPGLTTVPMVAVICVVCPVLTPVANPFALIVAAARFEEAQITCTVRFWVLLSL